MTEQELRDYPIKPRSATVSVEEAARSPDEPREAGLATIGADGAPHVVPMWFEFDGKHVWMSTSKKSVKTKNIMRNNRVALLVDERLYGLRQRAVVIFGKAELLEEGSKEFAARIYAKYLKDETVFRSPDVQRSMNLPRYNIKVTPTKILAWDYSKHPW